MEKWEYKRQDSTSYLTEEEFISWLNEEGQEGWEMIKYESIDISTWRKYYTCIFKRKIQQG